MVRQLYPSLTRDSSGFCNRWGRCCLSFSAVDLRRYFCGATRQRKMRIILRSIYLRESSCPARSPAAASQPCHSRLTVELSLGCIRVFYRYREKDFLFGEQWNVMVEAGDLSLLTAFSRQNPDPRGGRVYVQRRIREESHLVARLIVDSGANVLVSGSAKQMPRDVREAFRDALATHDSVSSISCSVDACILDSLGIEQHLLSGAIAQTTEQCLCGRYIRLHLWSPAWYSLVGLGTITLPLMVRFFSRDMATCHVYAVHLRGNISSIHICIYIYAVQLRGNMSSIRSPR